MNQPIYNIRAIRKLLTEVFKRGDDLYQFCSDFPEFKPVAGQLSSGMGKDEMIQRLIEYSERKVLLGRLLEIIKAEEPAQFEQFEHDILGTKKPQPAAPGAGTEDVQFLENMIVKMTRRLQVLQLQAAQYGISTPPHIAIEIEDLEQEIAQLKEKRNASR